MKLEVFFASDGDCLLLTSSDGRRALIDGGRTETFRKQTWPALQAMAKAKQAIDLVVVSHIDADHISGILWLMKAVAAWSVHDYQTTTGGNPGFPEPDVARPPEIKGFWHNSWRAQLGDLADPIEALASKVDDGLRTASFDLSQASRPGRQVVAAFAEIAESIPDGVDLLRIVDEETPLDRNKPFKDLVLLRDPPHVQKLGKTRLTVIGPAEKHLERLREEWRNWLKKPAGRKAAAEDLHPRRDAQGPAHGVSGTDFVEARTAEGAEGRDLVRTLIATAETIIKTDPANVTPPNRASITLLAEEGDRTCLLTGDAAEEEIIEGLEAAGRFVDGKCWCNVVKVQHHGSEHNLSVGFASQVLADQYVFCADGGNENPDLGVVKTLVETRRDADPRPFTVWFNCAPERALPSRRKHMRAAIKEARSAAKGQSRITVNVLDAAKPSVEIKV